MTKTTKSKKLPVRQVLILSLISQVLVAVGLMGYFSWRNGRKTVEDLALHLNREVTSHTQKHIDDYLHTPTTFLEINRVFTKSNNLNVNNLEDLQTSFWQQTQINPQINTLYFGSETGDFVEVEMNKTSKVSIRNFKTAPYWETYSLDEKGNKASLIATKKYDPRVRPWYVAAQQQDDLIWSPIYLFTDPPVLGITPAIPIKDEQTNKLQGVMAIDLTLKDVSNFLRSLKISDSGRVFIVEKSGNMVATSTDNPLVKKDSGGNQRLHYSESLDPLVRATGEFLDSKSQGFQNTDLLQQLIFEFEHGRHFIQATSLEGYPGLDWLVITVIPESNFSYYIQKNTHITLLLSALALISAIILGVIANQRILRSVSSLEQTNQQLNRLANIDQLTQVYNRYHFDLKLEQLWQESMEARTKISLILCDIDSFKLYNDTYGHLNGDLCLNQVAQEINKNINRSKDVVARYGGEEFAIVLFGTNAKGALHLAKKVKSAVRNLNIPHSSSLSNNYVTISCGVSCSVPSPHASYLDLIRNADVALYEAKRHGKNRCILNANKR